MKAVGVVSLYPRTYIGRVYSVCTNYNIYNEYTAASRLVMPSLLSYSIWLGFSVSVTACSTCSYTFLWSVCFKLPFRYFFLSVSIYSHIIFDFSRYRHPTPYILRLSCSPFLTSLHVQHLITYLSLVSLLFTPSFPHLLSCFFFSSIHSISFPLYPPPPTFLLSPRSLTWSLTLSFSCFHPSLSQVFWNSFAFYLFII